MTTQKIIADPIIKQLPAKQLAGQCLRMNLANNQTGELWRSFMPLRKTIKNTVGSNLYSLQVYDAAEDFKQFTMETFLNKWAAVEVSDVATLPTGIEPYTLHGGLYAVFLYKGNPSAFAETFLYIFNTWLPASGYLLDNSRAHFEILGEKYKNGSPDSEEEICIPLKEKN